MKYYNVKIKYYLNKIFSLLFHKNTILINIILMYHQFYIKDNQFYLKENVFDR